MTSFDKFMQEATAEGPDRIIPGCVIAVCKSGESAIQYKSFGTESIDPNSPLCHKSITPNTAMWIASCTKVMTAVCILQCVERGQLQLDGDISTILPNRKTLKILEGFDKESGEPILREAKEIITPRRLLTHQSGLGYDFLNDNLKHYTKYMEKNKGKVADANNWSSKLDYPLVFEPGTSWQYGVGVDWAGHLVEVVSGQGLEEYMKQHIMEPLGMTSTTFKLASRPDIAKSRADMTLRESNGKIVPSPTRYLSDNEPTSLGGGGLFSTTSDYIKVLQAILNKDTRLLKPDSMDLLFEPCLPPGPAKHYQKFRSFQDGQATNHGNMDIESPSKVDYALGGMVAMEGVEKGRKRGTLAWGGLPNLSWFIDRDAGFAVMFASQLLPAGDLDSLRLMRKAEAAIYSGEFFEGAKQL